MTVGVEDYKPSGAIHFIIGDSTEVLRISKEGITANPDVPVDEIAAKVLELLEQNITVLVQRAVEAEREACAQVCEQAGIDGYGTLAAAVMIRARGEQ
jgi:hypothetical protein